MVLPGSWTKGEAAGRKGVLSYYGPAMVLVVYHTPEVHGQVEAFLQSVKKAAAQKMEHPLRGKPRPANPNAWTPR